MVNNCTTKTFSVSSWDSQVELQLEDLKQKFCQNIAMLLFVFHYEAGSICCSQFVVENLTDLSRLQFILYFEFTNTIWNSKDAVVARFQFKKPSLSTRLDEVPE